MTKTALVIKTGAFGTYARLLRQVRETLILGQRRIEQEKVRTYWQTGKLINDFTLRHKDRADYGDRVVAQLAADLKINESVLHRSIRFAQKFPILADRPKSDSGGELTWSHYRALITIPDDRKRLHLAERAKRLEWTCTELEQAVKEEKEREWKAEEAAYEKEPLPEAKKTPDLLTPKRGTLYTYQVVLPGVLHAAKPGLEIDLGFSVYKEAAMKGASGLKSGDIVRSEWVEGDTYRVIKASGKTQNDLFTYKAYILRVVDGDTLRVKIDLGFGDSTRQYLRLRGIDAPEMKTGAGKQAALFAKKELQKAPHIILQSSRSDKYDRYLADVFYEAGGKEHYLNNVLLEHGLAKRIYV